MLCHPYPQEAEVGDDAICMCETIVQIFIKTKNCRSVKLFNRKVLLLCCLTFSISYVFTPPAQTAD